MWLMICSAQDAAALWAYHGLRARGLHPLELLTPEMLTAGTRWDHTVGVDADNFTITLDDGRVIDNRYVNGVINRLQRPSGAWRDLSELVWMASQSGLPTASYIQTSHNDHTSQMRRLVPEGTPTITAITLGNHVFGPNLPPHIGDACKALARLAQTPLLGIELTVQQSNGTARWTFAGATLLPDLRLGGEPLLDELARQLCSNRP